MNTINNHSFALISLLLLFIQPLQAAQSLSITSGGQAIDAAPAADYQPIVEKGVDKFEEYLLMLQKKCVETEKIKKGAVLLVGAAGSGKSTLICDFLGVSLEGVRLNNNDDDKWDEEDDDITCDMCIDIDPNNPPNFPVPKIGHNLAQSQTFFPDVFLNPNVKDGLYYCDLPGFYDTRGKDEVAIAAIAPALILHSMKRIQAVLAVLSYDNITSTRGEKFLEVITDVMTYFKHAPWDRIRKATFVCITKCAYVKNSTAVKALKDQIDGVYQALAQKSQEYEQAIDALKKGNLDKQTKKYHERTLADYEDLREKAKFFSIFAKTDMKTKKIVLDKNKLLFSRPLHKKRKDYRTKIIEALKKSPGLERKHLSKCDYSNPTLTHQLTKIVGRMNSFLSKHKNLKSQNEELQKSISSEQGISQQIKSLETQINDKSLELKKESTNTSLVVIYHPLPYERTFSLDEKVQNWCYGALGGATGIGIGVGVGAAAGASIGATIAAATAIEAAEVVGITVFTAVSGTAGTGAVVGAVDGGVDPKKKALKGALEGMVSFGSSITTHTKNIYRNTKPNKIFQYKASVPVYKMRVRYSAGTFKSTSPDGWQVNEVSNSAIKDFTYRPTNVSIDYPVSYVFEYMGYFHTNGLCELALYGKHNELEATKQRIKTLKASMSSKLETIATLTRDKKSKMQKIASNTQEIKRLDRCIRNTYEKREKDEDIAYSLSKCAMLVFFARKPLFNKGVIVQVNDGNDDKKEEEKEQELKKEEKEADHPLLAHMDRCIKQWKAWLSLAKCPPAQADPNEKNNLNNHQVDDNNVFDID